MPTIDGTSGNDINLGSNSPTDDTIYGYGGNDRFSSFGADTMYGSIGNDEYYVENAGDVVVEYVDEGWDSVFSYFTYTLGANVENLHLIGTGNMDGTGNELDNFLSGNAGSNILIGGLGNDQLSGGAGPDKLYGGIGNDKYWVDYWLDLVFENANEGTDLVYSYLNYTLGANLEHLSLLDGAAITGTGNGLDNHIYGNANNNTLNGGGGNDRLDGKTGADTMMGHTGDDWYYVDQAGDVVIENLNDGFHDKVFSTISYTLGANVENLELQGSAGISGTGNGLDNYLIGNSGDNWLIGGGGKDRLFGGVGVDTMKGDTGDDEYWVDNPFDIVMEFNNQGIDTVNASISYTLGFQVEKLALGWSAGAINGTGNELDNTLYGNDSANVLSGGNGKDILTGAGGPDTLIGGAGDDMYGQVDAGDTVIENANEGTDLVYSLVSYTLGANVEKLQLLEIGTGVTGIGNALDNLLDGNSLDNTLDGGLGLDNLYGGAGRDILYGGDGNDIIVGGTGADTMYGGTGDDEFWIWSLADAPAGGPFTDYIPDFDVAGGDVINLNFIDANTTASGPNNESFTAIGVNVAFSGTAGELRYNGGFLEGDVNGDAIADFQIKVDAVLTAGTDIIM